MARFDDLKARALSFLLDKNPDYAPVGVAHLAYSASLSALIARKRGLDMEIAQTAGYLHDLWLHWHVPYDDAVARRHAAEGAHLAEHMLRETRAYTDDEICTVRRMIENHDFLEQTHDEMSEIMKDADMLSHYLNASAAGRESAFHARVAKVLAELGVDVDILTQRGV